MPILAIAVGILIAAIDSRPSWDDAGVTAAAIALVSACLAATSQNRPWLLAIAVGIWVPFLGLASGDLATLLALAVAFAGAYFGVALRSIFAARA